MAVTRSNNPKEVAMPFGKKKGKGGKPGKKPNPFAKGGKSKKGC